MYQLEAEAQLKLQQALSFQESFWKQKAKVNLFCDGDRNTSYFHKVAKVRHASKQLSILKDGDIILDSFTYIENLVLQYFQSLYALDNAYSSNDLVSRVVPSLVAAEDNVMLSNLPSLEEVNSAVFSLNSDGAPGPDGFGGVFYQHFFSLIEKDVFNYVLQFFTLSWLLPNLNSNFFCQFQKFCMLIKLSYNIPKIG